MENEEGRKIRGVFERLRLEEERTAPEFHQVLHQKHSPSRALVWDLLRRPAAVLILLFLAAGPVLYFSLRETGVRENDLSSELEHWESPTSFLLGFNDSPLDSSLPEIGATFWKEDEIPNLEN
jgi:hypothetical protein